MSSKSGAVPPTGKPGEPRAAKNAAACSCSAVGSDPKSLRLRPVGAAQQRYDDQSNERDGSQVDIGMTHTGPQGQVAAQRLGLPPYEAGPRAMVAVLPAQGLKVMILEFMDPNRLACRATGIANSGGSEALQPQAARSGRWRRHRRREPRRHTFNPPLLVYGSGAGGVQPLACGRVGQGAARNRAPRPEGSVQGTQASRWALKL